MAKGKREKAATIGAYYFQGWAGKNAHEGEPGEEWAKGAPTHLSRRLVEEFPEREPAWGWRDDSLEIMERQIDIAADNGIEFFAFCWYWHDDRGPINREVIEKDPKHICLKLFLKARNRERMKMCFLVANHGGCEIVGTQAWKDAADCWLPWLANPNYYRLGGKPLLVIFNPPGSDREGLAYLQETAKGAGLAGVAVAGCNGGKVEDGYTHRTHYNIILGYDTGSEKHKYEELIKAAKDRWKGTRELPYMPNVTAGWDKRPWEGPKGLGQKEGWYYPDRTPEAFARFLEEAITWMDEHPEETPPERVVMLYAWNEFGEGGYVAPTKGEAKGEYLEVIEKAVGIVDS